MRRRLLAATALATIMLMAPGAFAQTGVVDWSGPYIGASIGGGGGTTNFDFAYVTGGGSPLAPLSIPTLGVSGTVTGGYNLQQDQFVYGIAADGTFLTLSGSAAGGSDPTYNIDTRLDALLSLRGRLGLTSGPLLYYVTAGAAAGHVTFTTNVIESGLGTPGAAVGNGMVFGPTYGAGVEYALNDTVSISTEGIVTNLGPLTATGDTGKGDYNANARTTSVNIRSGVNVHF